MMTVVYFQKTKKIGVAWRDHKDTLQSKNLPFLDEKTILRIVKFRSSSKISTEILNSQLLDWKDLLQNIL